MFDDNIKTYVMTASADVRHFCATCGHPRPVWVGETEGGDTLTCCGHCQRVLLRRRTDNIPKLSTNTAMCPHVIRRSYYPASTLGDESDYQSACKACGAILRDPPNA